MLSLLSATVLLMSSSDARLFVELSVSSPAVLKQVLGRNKGTTVERSNGNSYRLVVPAGTKPKAVLAGLSSVRGVRKAEAALPSWKKDPFATKSLTELRALRKRYMADYEVFAEVTGAESEFEEGEKEVPGLDYLDAYLYFFEERAFPNDEIDWTAVGVAAKHRDRMEPFGGVGTASLTGNWTFMGPTNLDTPYRIYYGLPPLNGRINGVAYDPSNVNTIYLASAQGGPWKSTNAGVNWSPLGDTWEICHTSCVTVDPVTPSTLYVGTGDFPGNRTATMGIMKSTNGGSTWTNIGRSDFGTVCVADIIVHPDSPSTIIAATGNRSGTAGKIWRSTNGGTTWSPAFSTNAYWSDLAISAPDSGVRRIYAAGGDSSAGELWRSSDSGATWTALSPPTSGSIGVLYVATSPTFPANVYLLSPTQNAIYKSTNYGTTWSSITAGFPTGYIWSQGSYNNALNCSSRSSAGTTYDVIYVSLIDVVQSRDSGATWQSVGGPTYQNSSILHNDQHCLAVDPTNPDRLMVGGDGGIFRFKYTPSTNTWSYDYLSANLGVTQFYKSAHHPTNANIALGGTQDNATPFVNGALGTWDNVGGGDGGFCAINPSATNEQYATSQNLNIYRTGNSWSSSSGISPSVGSDSVAFIAPIVLDPNNGDLLYAGTNYLYRRNDATGSWTNRLGSQVLSSSGNLRSIAIAPGDGAKIYTGASDGQVWMSSNSGTNWTQINTGTPSLPVRTITYFSVNPTNKNDILVGVSGTGTGHLFRCTNTTAGTRIWTDVSGSGANGLPNIALNAISRDPWLPQTTWYVGTDVGVFGTVDAGATWQNMTAPLGLPNVQVNDLKAVQGSGYLFAATYARGMWRIPIGQNLTVSGNVSLENWSVSHAGRTCTFEIYSPGTNTLLETVNATLNASGNYSFATTRHGVYDIYCKSSHWLRRVRTNVLLGPANTSGVSFTLENGDVDPDNEVNIVDYGHASLAFGTMPGDANWNQNADLDGDLEVTLLDVAIVATNFGDIGD